MSRRQTVKIGFLIAVMVCICGCVKPIDGQWANGFTAQSAGFEKLSVFTDMTVVSLTPRGEEFLWIAESIQNAREMDNTTVEILKSKGYAIGTHERFFIGSWCKDAYPTSFAMSRRTLVKKPPFHIDPGVERLDELSMDIQTSFRQFAQMIGDGKSALAAGSLPGDVTRRIAGNYRSSGIVLILAVARRIEPENEQWPAFTTENMYNFKAPFIAIGYFEGMTGKLVYSNFLPISKNQKTKDLAKNFAQFHINFPIARVASRFKIPPPPEYTKKVFHPLDAITLNSDEEEGVTRLNFAAFISQGGGVPFYSKPDINFRVDFMAPAGTMVNVIGKKSIFSKVILPDGRVGWVPTDTVWVRK
jgi:hypothetical protein